MKKRIKGIKEKISKVWKDKTSELKLKRSLYKHNYYRAQETWMNMDDERQIYCAKYLPQILMSENGLYIDDILDTLNYTCEEAQALNSQMFTDLIPHMENLEKNGKNGDFNIARAIAGLWGVMKSKTQKQNQEPFEKTIKEHPEYLPYVWTHADEKVKKDNADVFPDVLKMCKTDEEIKKCIDTTDKSIYRDSIEDLIYNYLEEDIEQDKRRYVGATGIIDFSDYKGLTIFNSLDNEMQEKMLFRLLETAEKSEISIYDVIYDATNEEVRERVKNKVKQNGMMCLEKLNSLDIDNLSKEQQEVEQLLDNLLEYKKSIYYLKKVGQTFDEHDEIMKRVAYKFGQSKNKLTNENVIRKIMSLTNENPEMLNFIWKNVDPETQESLIEDVMKLAVDERYRNMSQTVRSNNIYGIMLATNEDIQNKKIVNLIELANGDDNTLRALWYGVSKDNKKQIIEGLINNEELIRNNPNLLNILWEISSNEKSNNYYGIAEMQKDKQDLLPKVIKVLNSIEGIDEVTKEQMLDRIIMSTRRDVLDNNVSTLMEVANNLKHHPQTLEGIYNIVVAKGIEPEGALKIISFEKYLEEIIAENRFSYEKMQEIIKNWNDNRDIQIFKPELVKKILDLAEKIPDIDRHYYGGIDGCYHTILKATDKNVIKEYDRMFPKWVPSLIKSGNYSNEIGADLQNKYKDLLLEIAKDNPMVVVYQWMSIDHELQKEIIDKVIERVKDNPIAVSSIWSVTDKEVQKVALEKNPKLLEGMIKKVKNNPDAVASIWGGTDKEVQKVAFEKNPKLLEEIIELVKDDYVALAKTWEGTDKKIQENKIVEVTKLVKDHQTAFFMIWTRTDKKVQKNKIAEVIEKVKGNKVLLQNMFKNYIDSEIIFNNIKNIYEKLTGKNEIPEQYEEKIKFLYEKNNKLFATLNWEFLDKAIEEGYTDEQMLRITNYPEVQEFISQYKDNKIMNNAIKYMLEKDSNWILSIERIKNNNQNYNDLLNKISINIKEEDIDDKFIQNVLLVISNRENYFNIQTVEDVKNYNNIKNNICENILNGKIENIPESLKKYPKEQQYKFALLEYKFGIDLEEAEFLINRYGTDVEKILEKMPDKLEAKYLYALKEIVKSDNIEEIIEELRKNNALEKPWSGFPSARNAEGQIINMFAELYNETLYKPREEDKLVQQESYIDKEGKEHKIDVYNINGDFDMNIRVEGAYNPEWREPENFVDYYNYPDIDSHGNCESFIGNDIIASARFSRGVMVGYSIIRENSLTASGPYDLRFNK